MKTFIAAAIAVIVYAQEETVAEEAAAVVYPQVMGQKNPWKSAAASEESSQELTGEWWTVQSEEDVYSLHVAGDLKIKRTDASIGYSWFQLAETANENTDATAAKLQADYDLFYFSQKNSSDPKNASASFVTKFTSEPIEETTVEEVTTNNFLKFRNGNYSFDTIEGSWVQLSAAQSAVDSTNKTFSFKWEVGRPYLASTFNLKANTSFEALVGSAVAANKSGQAVYNNGKPSFATVVLEVTDSAAALAAGAVAVAAVLAF